MRADGEMVFGAKSNTLRRGSINIQWNKPADFADPVTLIIAAYNNTEYLVDASGAVNMQGF